MMSASDCHMHIYMCTCMHIHYIHKYTCTTDTPHTYHVPHTLHIHTHEHRRKIMLGDVEYAMAGETGNDFDST